MTESRCKPHNNASFLLSQLQRRSHFPFLSHIEHKGSNSSSRIQMEVVQFLVWKAYITNIVYRNLEGKFSGFKAMKYVWEI